jgi:hypothetical protein
VVLADVPQAYVKFVDEMVLQHDARVACVLVQTAAPAALRPALLSF